MKDHYSILDPKVCMTEVHRFIGDITKSGDNFGDDPDILWQDSKDKFYAWLLDSKLNNAKNLDKS